MEKICLQVVDQDTVFYSTLCNAVLTPVFCCLVGVLYFVVSSETPSADDLQFALYEGLKHWWYFSVNVVNVHSTVTVIMGRKAQTTVQSSMTGFLIVELHCLYSEILFSIGHE